MTFGNIFLIFPSNWVDISCKLPLEETFYLKYQTLFSGKNKKKKCRNFSLSFTLAALGSIGLFFFFLHLVSLHKGFPVNVPLLRTVHFINIILLIQHVEHQIQSNLVISYSLISNYRLSRSENLVPVLT